MTAEFGNIAKIMEATVSFVAKEIVVKQTRARAVNMTLHYKNMDKSV